MVYGVVVATLWVAFRYKMLQPESNRSDCTRDPRFWNWAISFKSPLHLSQYVAVKNIIGWFFCRMSSPFTYHLPKLIPTTGPRMPRTPKTAPNAIDECICQRAPSSILCEMCGYSWTGRMNKVCSIHPNVSECLNKYPPCPWGMVT